MTVEAKTFELEAFVWIDADPVVGLDLLMVAVVDRTHRKNMHLELSYIYVLYGVYYNI